MSGVLPANAPATDYQHTKSRVLARTSITIAVAALVLGSALFSSGMAGLINQVIWQRSLKVFLGGSESICSMVVVLVFMAGLGIGSLWMGLRASRLRRPLVALGVVELLLGAVNVGICGLFAKDLSDSVFAFQSITNSIGVPLLALYALTAIGLLIVPCFLMGATMPLAAEACQKALGGRNTRLIGLLFFINTMGSVVGTICSSGWMLSGIGQYQSLIVAASMNGVAGILVLGLHFLRREGNQAATRLPGKPTSQLSSVKKSSFWADLCHPRLEEILALGLGFCSLGYEMYLFRLIPLRHQPLPFTFAAVLAGFLLFWSLGAALSSRQDSWTISGVFRVCAITVAMSIPMYLVDTLYEVTNMTTLVLFIFWKAPYFVPCLFFGYLFSRIASRVTVSWGNDVGRVYAWNTVGSCLGIVAITLVGYELPFFIMAAVIALLLYAMQEYFDSHDIRKQAKTKQISHQRPQGAQARQPAKHFPLARWWFPPAAATIFVALCFVLDLSRIVPGATMYSSRSGVILLDDEGNMMWDGLWHSKLSSGSDHIGTNNWYLAVAPALCHGGEKIEDVCVIGVATGITASTLAKLESVRQVDGYDISSVLTEIHHDFPAGTLEIATNPKINMIWQDARSGLALNPKQYDLIQTQPLYLKQAGSALLNSKEFFQLVKSRLKPGGIFCLYSNGSAEQAFVIRETADQVFPYRETFLNGYLVILSSDPITLSAEVLQSRIDREGLLWQEIRNWPLTESGAAIMQLVDHPRLPSADGTLIVTDDHPIVEYPHYLFHQLRARGWEKLLTAPREQPPSYQEVIGSRKKRAASAQ